MQHINIIAVGKLKERFWVEACQEYLKRLKPYASVDVTEIADIPASKAGSTKVAVEQEGQAILKTLPKDTFIIVLDIDAQLVSSEKIASELERMSLDGINDIAFIIGGSDGISDEVRSKAQARWSLGRITLPHNLARVVLLEQIYRAFKIIKKEPYHK